MAFQDCEERLAASTTSYLCNNDRAGHTIELGDFFQEDVEHDHGVFSDRFTQDPYRVSIGAQLDGGSARTVMCFQAADTRGYSVLYVLYG